MGLDDRLRSAHQRRLSDTRRRLADSDHNYDEPVDPPIPLRRSSRVLAIAAVVAVLAGGTLAVTSPWDDDGSINAELGPAGEQTSLGQSAADGDEQTESDSSADADESAAEGATVSVPVQQGTSTPASPDTTPGSTSATTPGSTSATTPGSTTASTPESTAAPTTGASSTGPPTDVGVESDVCPSGRRATLERAELRYIGENEGWSRLDDLVDEQDGPFYFNGWEPGYPNDVTVELQLAEPALAQDIRIAQDPYTPVNGLIAIGVVGEGVNLEMSGTGGWRVHDFGEPRLVGSFTINRQNSEANVMEVLICLARD